jgi:hypothetical protein
MFGADKICATISRGRGSIETMTGFSSGPGSSRASNWLWGTMTVEFPHPETPMTTTTLGEGSDVSSVSGICTDINPLLPARRRDP